MSVTDDEFFRSRDRIAAGERFTRLRPVGTDSVHYRLGHTFITNQLGAKLVKFHLNPKPEYEEDVAYSRRVTVRSWVTEYDFVPHR